MQQIDNLTGHSMVLNEERYIRQMIRSITPYLNRHIFCDTGSNDATIQYIEEAQKQYPQIELWKYPLQKDCTRWNGNHLSNHLTQIRNDMIKDTKTEFCLQVDGDEIYHPELAQNLQKALILCKALNLIGGMIPIKWCINNTSFIEPGPFHQTLRIFSSKVIFRGEFPNEFGYYNDIPIYIHDRRCLSLKNYKPFLHMSIALHPDRRPQNGQIYQLSEEEQNLLKI